MFEAPWVARAIVLCLTALVVAVGLSDWRQRRIPNALVFPAMLLGLTLNSLKGWDALKTAGIGLAAGFAVLFVQYLLGGLRAGDVKFFAAVGAFLGAPQIVRAFFLTLLCYPLLAIFFVTRERKWGVTWRRFRILFIKLMGTFVPAFRLYLARLEAADDPAVESVRTPFSLAIAMGTLLTLYTGFLAYLI